MSVAKGGHRSFLFALALSSGPVALAAFQASASLPPDSWVLLRSLLIVWGTALVIAGLLRKIAIDAHGAEAGVLVVGIAAVVNPGLVNPLAQPHPVRATAYLAFAALIAVAAARGGSHVRRELSRLAMPVALAIAALGASMVAAGYHLRGPSMLTEAAYRQAAADVPRLRAGSAMPDIYHVVLDGLGRLDVLERRYGVEAAPVLQGLQARSFRVQERGVANYTQTYLSMASVLNAGFLTPMTTAMAGQQARAPLVELTQRSTVIRSLRALGYGFHYLGSGQPAGASHRLADRCDCAYPIVGEFESHLLRLTSLADLPWYRVQHVPHRTHVLELLNRLEALSGDDPRPRLVIAHLMAPHPPFTFGSRGEDVTPARPFTVADGNAFPAPRTEYVTGYRGQATYVLHRLPGLADRFVAQSQRRGREALIVFHGDHGPRSTFDAMDPSRTDASEVLPVLLAWRWPSNVTASAPPRSLVNLYRQILSEVFGAELPPLPDRAFVSSFTRPYDLLEIAPLP